MSRTPWIRRRSVLLVSIAVLVALALAWGFREPPPRVDVAEVVRGPFRVSFEEEGRTRVKDRFEVSAPIAGQLARVDLEPGDRVARGDPLFRIAPSFAPPLDARDHAQAAAAVARAESALQAAGTQLVAAQARSSLADREVERLQPLAESGHVSALTLDRALSEARSAAAMLRSARFAIDVARHERAMAQAVLDVSGRDRRPTTVDVTSPLDATVLARHRESEGAVQAGAPIVTLGDVDSLEVAVDVLSPDAVRLEPGMPVELERWGGEATLAARVRRVEPAGFTKVSALGVEEQRVWVILEFENDRERRRALGDGYRVLARFIVWQGDDVLQAPAGALFREGERHGVFVLDGDRARLRSVEVGRRSGLLAEIVAGLEPRERVILHPGQQVRDGERVRVR